MAKTIKLHTGAEMPTIGLGTWKSSPGDVYNAVVAALEAGYKHIDCAAIYGNEPEVGAAIQDCISRGVIKREDLFVTSKLWISRAYPDECIAACEQTLKDLKLDYLDLYLIHWPFLLKKGSPFPPASKSDVFDFDAEKYIAVWHELEKLVSAGKVRSLGVSNLSIKKLEAIYDRCTIKPSVNQVELHPFLAQNDLKEWCEARNIVLTAYSPLGSPDRPSAEDADPAPLHDDTIKAIASKHSVSPAQVLLRWAVQRGTIAIPKSTNPTRIADNLNVYHFSLDADDMAKIASLDLGLRLIKGQPFMREGQTDWRDNWT